MNATIIRKEGSWKLLRRMGIAGTLFFTIKGLLWLVVPLLMTKWL